MEANDKQRYIAILLQTMKAFDAFCSEHDLRYFACGGTAIGAVRHKGMIPWDDDIDVYMPREDYERLIELQDKLSDSPYELVGPMTKGYYLPFSKFSYRHSTVWEYEAFPCLFGVYVDIFVLDETADSITEIAPLADQYKYYLDRYLRSLQRHDCGRLFRLATQRNLKGLVSSIWDILYYIPRRSLLRRKCEILLADLRKLRGNNYICYGLSITNEREIFPKELFREYVYMPFDNIKVRMPIGYDQYLTQQYGDYMSPPPLSGRESTHEKFYLDLERRLSIHEIQQIKQL